MRTVVEKEMRDVDRPSLPDLDGEFGDLGDFVPEHEQDLSETEQQHDLSTQVDLLEKRRDGLVQTISSLSDKIQNLKKEYAKYKVDFKSKVEKLNGMIVELSQKKQQNSETFQHIDHHQRALVETIE